eukprot:707622-Amphidinium_carterae.1
MAASFGSTRDTRRLERAIRHQAPTPMVIPQPMFAFGRLSAVLDEDDYEDDEIASSVSRDSLHARNMQYLPLLSASSSPVPPSPTAAANRSPTVHPLSQSLNTSSLPPQEQPKKYRSGQPPPAPVLSLTFAAAAADPNALRQWKRRVA